VACVGKILFTINEIGEGFLASPATAERGHQLHRGSRQPLRTLTFTSFNGTAVNVTFGDGSNGTVKTLDQLNAAVLANNLPATLDSAGKLTISATNDDASSTLGSAAAGGAIGGTLTTAITFTTPSAPVVDASAQAVRSNLVNPFNGILARITTTSQDASFNIKTAGILRRFCYEFVNRA
jgi:lysozyme family protein